MHTGVPIVETNSAKKNIEFAAVLFQMMQVSSKVNVNTIIESGQSY